jgi:hypothetical protein
VGLILDTGILIASERRRESVGDILRQVRAVHGETDIALSAVSVVELTHGIYRARNDADRERRRVFAEGVFQDIIVSWAMISRNRWKYNAAALLFTPTSEAAARAVEPDTKCSIKRLCTDHSSRFFRIWKPS